MTAHRVDRTLVATRHSASGVTINGGANYYAGLGSVNAVPGMVPVGVRVDMSGMTNYNNLVAGSIQDNGTWMWVRIYNSQSTACSGSWSATVYWAKAASP